ncbi:hypothetical protein SAMN02910298_02848 [Pseudobutyrivibrio sp. YE44]|uniref:hypothetical protein n=1 Tax=Pseudobutyrivibrio sp. YE44 TaxID=1520802 RepID=UPI0008899DEF|nr:hypothetical protein [Pseudobutyrivibrio sp. YE44]SDB55492.1 hypothetical protein SAMN02910298_02848 [Pseudobutyrivibrio sp. YE44]
MIGASAKRMKLANYMSSLPEIYEVIEDNLGEEEPSIKLQTKTRSIFLYCDSKGNVVESFEMLEGGGTKEDFIAKKEAYDAIRKYYEDYYTGARITKSSFDEGLIKLQVDDRIVTLTYDYENKGVDETDRLRPRKKTEKKKETIDQNQLSIFDIKKEDTHAGTTYDKWLEGTIVKNRYNQKKYTVKKDFGNTIEVKDGEYGYITMARADLERDIFSE